MIHSLSTLTLKCPLAQAREESKLNPATFVDDATDQFKKWFLSAEAKNVNITIQVITCGSITLKFNVMAHSAISNEDFRAALKTSATTFKMKIQGRVVKPSELEKAAESAEIDQPTEPPTNVTDQIVKPTKPTEAGLSGGATAGIVIGVLIFLLVIGFVIFKSKKGSRRSEDFSSSSRVKLSEIAE
jgi:hypothetical protein